MLVSIVLPIYKVEAYLRKCLDSLMRQTYTELEIILVDDGSPDSCGLICDEYARKDGRFVVLHKENGGVSSARRAGLKICTGRYVMFVDPDDYLAEDAVQLLYERLLADGSDMAVGKFALLYENGDIERPLQSLWAERSVCAKEDILCRDGGFDRLFVSLGCKLYKKELLDGIEFPPLKVGEDLWIHPLVLDRCDKISLVDSWVYYYFQRTNSAMKQISDEARYHQVSAYLHMAKYVYDKGYDARRWYVVALANAFHIKKRSDRVGLIRRFFNKKERRSLLKGASLKDRVRWICIHTPFSF